MSGTRLRTRATARAKEQLDLSCRVMNAWMVQRYELLWEAPRCVSQRIYTAHLDGVDGYPIQRFFRSCWLYRERL